MADKNEKKQLAVVNSMVEDLASLPEELVSEIDAIKATDLILKVRKMFTEVEEHRKERTAPANETIKLINEDHKPFLTPLKDLEGKLKTLLEGYATKRVSEDLKRLAEIRTETGDKTLMLPIGLNSIPSANGEVRFRKAFSVIVVDEAKVPRKYKTMTIDMKQIQKDVDDAEGIIKIAGIEVVQTSTLALYTK